MKRFLFFASVVTIAISFAFNSFERKQQNRSILLIPFSRFELHTEIKLSVLNEVNGLSEDQFYPLLLNSFTEAFLLNSTERVSYKIISEEDYADIGIFLRYELIPGKGHYTCNLENLNKKTLKEILDKYECENLMTINWYRIMKDKTSYKKNNKKIISMYSSHFIDFDLFTREGTVIREGSRLKIEVPASASNIEYMGLRIQDLKPEFKKLVDDVSVRILSED